MTRSDETKARLKNLNERIQQSESAGAGRVNKAALPLKNLKITNASRYQGIYTAEMGILWTQKAQRWRSD
jgi:hypothetical protein